MSDRAAQAAMAAASRDLASLYRLPIVDVGGPFVRLADKVGSPELYESDSHHPSEAGAYLAAAVMFQALTGEDPAHSSYRPESVSGANC